MISLGGLKCRRKHVTSGHDVVYEYFFKWYFDKHSNIRYFKTITNPYYGETTINTQIHEYVHKFKQTNKIKFIVQPLQLHTRLVCFFFLISQRPRVDSEF